MRVLGIDPGSRFMGYGVIEERLGRPVHVAHGVLKADGDAPLELRLKELFGGVQTAIQLYQPASVAVEGLFTFKNARSALVLGHARGIALLAAAQAGLDVHEYSPARVKKAVGAGGNDGKDAVARMIRTWLGVEDLERADASDALAVALCHLNAARAGFALVSPAKAASRSKKKNAYSQLADRISPSVRRFGGNAR